MSIWLQFRESMLDVLVKTSNHEVLNTLNASHSQTDILDLSQQLNRAMQQFKAEAFRASGSMVDYDKLRKSIAYQRYTQELIPQLRDIDLGQLKNENEARTFWINLYNALVIHAVIAFEIKESVTEGSPLAILRFFRRAAYRVGGHFFRLDDIEHGILRNNAGNPVIPGAQFCSTDPRLAFSLPLDPRIHFALNCASASCPSVDAYAADQLDSQLDAATRNFLRHEIKLDKNSLCLSRIFLWYRKDFGSKMDLLSFLRKHTSNEFWGNDGAVDFNIEYNSYNWQLNT